MKIRAIRAHAQKPVEMPGAQGAKIRLLIGPEEGATSFHMRQFEIAPGGCTPHH
jgi:quercetin dioxygenase-like cupin family protein